MELALLAEAKVLDPLGAGLRRLLRRGLDRRDFDLFRVIQPQGQFVAVYAQLHGVAKRRVFHQRDLHAGNHAHIEKMLAKRAFAAHSFDARGQIGRAHV